MTRLDVVTQVQALLRRGDCPATLALTFLTQGIQRTERQLRVPSLERAVHIVPAATTHSVTIPNDLLQFIDVVASGRPLDKLPHRVLMQRAYRNPTVGSPTAYSRFGTGIYFDPPLQVGDDVVISYYGTMTPMGSDTDTNEGTENFPDVLTYAALTFAGDYFRHDETDAWEAKYQQLLTETQDEATQIDATGGPMMVQSAYQDT